MDRDRDFSLHLQKFLKIAGVTSEDCWELGETRYQIFVISISNGLGERGT